MKKNPILAKKILMYFVALIIITITVYPGHRGKSATPTGDEPHYFVMMESILGDRDLNVSNNYRTTQHEWIRNTSPHLLQAEEEIYPLHRWGLPIIFSPAYHLFGYTGVMIFFSLLTLASVELIYRYLIEKYNDNEDNLKVLFAFIYCTPLLIYCTQVYPETIMFVLISTALYLGRKFRGNLSRIVYASTLTFMAAILHEKLIIAIVPVLYLIMLRRSFLLLIITGLLSGGVFIIWLYFIYGYDYLDFSSVAGAQYIGYKNMLRSLLIVLFDQRSGIIWFFPLILLSTLRLKFDGKFIFPYLLPYLILVLMFQESHAGFVPPGRYLYPFIPFAFLGIGLYIIKNNVNKIFIILSSISMLILMGYILMPGIIYPHWSIPNGYMHYIFGIGKSTSIPLPEFNTNLPPFSFETIREYLRSIPVAVLLLVWIIHRSNSKNKSILMS